MTGNIALLLTIYSLWIIAGLVAFGWEFARRRWYASKADVGPETKQAKPFTDGSPKKRDPLEVTFGSQLPAH